MKKIICLVIFVVVSGDIASAETVILKSGKQYEGSILEKTQEYIKMDIGVGMPITYFLNEIESIGGKVVVHEPTAPFVQQKDLSSSKEKYSTRELHTPSNKSLDRLYNVACDLGYNPEKSVQIAEFILPIYKKFKYRDINDSKKLIQDIERNKGIIRDSVLDAKLRPHPEHFKLYALLVDEQAAEFLKARFFGIDNLSDEQRYFVHISFLCNYFSFLGYIIHKAKGIDILGVYTDDIAPLERFAKSQKGWVFDPLGASKRLEKLRHNLCLIRMKDKQCMFIDFVNEYTSRPFMLDLIYRARANNKFELAKDIRRDDLFRECVIYEGYALRAGLYSNLTPIFAIFGQNQNAMEYINKAYELAPNDHGVLMNTGNVYSHSGYYQEAIPYYQKALELDPNDADVIYNLGFAYHNLEQYQRAMDYYQKAIAVDPAHFGAYNNLGGVYNKFKQYKTAIPYIQKAIKLGPDNTQAYENLAISYFGLGRNAEAKRNIKKSLELNKKQGNWDSVDRLQQILQRLSRH
ncbi:MAG: tetratricopeptide repeat protein [Candidatus Omnitrophota bacterium]